LILTAGLSPVFQQVLVFDAVTLGEVNRAREVFWCASGKVLNAARALRHLGAPGKALTVLGGSTGDAIRRDFARLGIPARWVEVARPTRVCTTVLEADRRTATELVPDAGEISESERAAFLAAYAEEAAAAAVVVLIGSLPVGTPADFYRELVGRTPGKVVLDARGPELLDAVGAAGPFLIKPNRGELQSTLGRSLAGDEDVFGGMREMNGRGAEWVVITDGPNPIHASSHDGLYRLRPPPVPVVNPIGCGDCMAAGIAWGLHRGLEPVEAIRLGVAVAADKLGRPLPGAVERDQVEALVRSVEVTRL
jgi:1-phosphofructokinase family hexose kinase